jgi:hypothetical protein
MAKGTPRSEADWERVELEYRAGVLTLREIADRNGITHAAVLKRAKRDSWTRDLTERINARAAELVAKQVSEEVTSTRLKNDEAVVDGVAAKVADSLLSHRKDIKRYNALSQSLLSELEASTDNTELFGQLGELLRSENEKGVDKLNDIYQKVIAMPGRVDSLKKLSEVLKTLIGLERQALGMSDNANGDANTPKGVPQMSDHEAARRVAFLLQKGIRGTP